jgi:hypothetical protein
MNLGPMALVAIRNMAPYRRLSIRRPVTSAQGRWGLLPQRAVLLRDEARAASHGLYPAPAQGTGLKGTTLTRSVNTMFSPRIR